MLSTYSNSRFVSSRLFVTNDTAAYRNDAPANTSSNNDILQYHLRHSPSTAEIFQVWRTAKSLDLMPLVVINALYMLIGVVGNSTVCYVCAIRMPRTVLNSFVLSLAIAELMGCILIIPIEITKTVNAYSFDYPVLCKTEKYLRSLVIFFTNCILIAIATERYQRIVKPHNRHVTMFQFRLTVVGSIIFAALAAVPEAVLAGNQTLNSKFGKGVICSTYCSDSYTETVFPPVWACFVVLVYAISISAIGSIYCIIAITIWKRGKIQTDRRSRSNTPDVASRRQIQFLYSNNQQSTLNLSHHYSLISSQGRQNKTEFSHGSLDRYELRTRQKLRNNPDFRMLSTRASSSDDLEIQVEVHHQGYPISRLPGGLEEEDGISNSRPASSSMCTNASIYRSHDHRSNHHYDHQQQLSREENDEEQNDRDSVISCRDNITTLNPVSKLPDPMINTSDLRHHARSRNSDGKHCKQSHDSQNLSRPHSQSHHTRKERRRLTGVFFDELYQTISRRRQRQEVEFFERQASMEDILTPPPLTPAGSIKSRSGYSRKRTTFIMFVMTATTALSLLPHTVVLLYRLAQPSIEIRLSPDASVLFYLAWNSFFISLASHPYVYGFRNGRFKKALLSLFDGFREKRRRRRLSGRDEDYKDNSFARN